MEKWFMLDSHPDDRARYAPAPDALTGFIEQAKEFYKTHPAINTEGHIVLPPSPDEDWQSSHPRCCE